MLLLAWVTDDARHIVWGLQTQELTGLKETRQSVPDTATEIRSSLAPQLARINRGLQASLTIHEKDLKNFSMRLSCN